jgi:hypothetical protein
LQSKKHLLIWTILPRVALGCALLLGIFASRSAHAGAMYRCVGTQGEAVFSSTQAGYHDCKRLGGYAEPVRRHAELAESSTGGPPSFAWVSGSVETSAHAIEPLVVSLAGALGSVETTARLLPMPALAGKPGQWNYQDSHDDLPSAAAAVVPSSPDNRILTGAVYRVVHPDGSVEYTNLPPAGAKAHDVTRLFSYIATCMACNLHSPIHWDSVRLDLTDYADVIRNASMEFGVDEALVRAIIHAESAFNPHAMSLKGAQGLMQLMPSTANDMGVMDAFDPIQNIRGGARYLALLVKNFNGDPRLVAAAYNAGPAAVLHYKGVPPYAETQVYVVRVGELLQRYKSALHPPLAEAIQDRSVNR